ncbi:hypothetical protein JCM16358_23130 [Halanaerocella petrolearia]
MGIKLTGDFNKFNQDLKKLVDFNFTGLHKEIGEYLVEATKDRFKDEESPDGDKWEKSHRAKAEGGKTLSDKGTLKNSITYKATSKKTDVGSNIIYAAVHQQGKEIKVKNADYLHFKAGGRWAKKKKVEIPARPFLGISEEDQVEVKHIIKDRIDNHLGS